MVNLLPILIVVSVAMIPAYADYGLNGVGYATSDQQISDTSIDLKLDSTKVALQGGLQIGDQIHSLKNIDLSFFQNSKIFRLGATSNDGLEIRGTGRLVTSSSHGSIYQMNGLAIKDDASQRLNLSLVLTQSESKIQTEAKEKQDVLLLVKHFNRVQWKNLYKFTAKTFDPKSNHLSNFDQTSGYVKGVGITAKITDPLGNVIKISNGTTTKFGYYEDRLLIPDNARTGPYVLNVTAYGENYKTTSKELTFFVIPLGTNPTAE
jgi:hypothetical protein